MRNFQTLDQFSVDQSTGIAELVTNAGTEPKGSLALKKEGDYLAISASYGAIEIALRPRLSELTHALSHMQPNDGIQTARNIGSSESHLGIGLRVDGSLNLRPTLIQDATGYLALNFRLSSDACKSLFVWLGIATK